MRSLQLHAVVIAVSLLLMPQLRAQGPSSSLNNLRPSDLLGYWEVSEPTGAFFFIIKSGADVSGFWSGSSGNRMVKGNWKIIENKAVITWADGHRDVLAPTQNGFIKYDLVPGQSMESEPETVLRAQKIDPREVGLLRVQSTDTRAPAAPAAPIAETDPPLMRNEFIGFWEISGKRLDTFYLHLRRDGKAQSAYREHRQAPKSIEGEWVIEGSEARITWDNNHHDMIINTGAGYKLNGISSRSKFEAKAVKIEPLHGQSLFKAGGTSSANIDRFLGIWEISSQDRNYFIEVKNWGQSTRYLLGEKENLIEESGKWKLLSIGLMIVWKDGSKDVMRWTKKGLQKDSFPKGASITGVPLHQSPAKPVPEETAELIFRKRRGS